MGELDILLWHLGDVLSENIEKGVSSVTLYWHWWVPRPHSIVGAALVVDIINTIQHNTIQCK